jgi:hypothetical protein
VPACDSKAIPSLCLRVSVVIETAVGRENL